MSISCQGHRGAAVNGGETLTKQKPPSRTKRNGKQREKVKQVRGFCFTSFPSSNTAVPLSSLLPLPFLSLTISKQTHSLSHTWRAFKTAIAHKRSQAPHTHSSEQRFYSTHSHMFCITHCIYSSVVFAGWQVYLCCGGCTWSEKISPWTPQPNEAVFLLKQILILLLYCWTG